MMGKEGFAQRTGKEDEKEFQTSGVRDGDTRLP